MGDWFIEGAISWLALAVAAVIELLWGLLSNTAFTTPDVTALPQVAAISARSAMVVNVSFVLAVIAVGVVVMARETVQTRYGLGELAPRLVIGWIGANFAGPICAQLIQLANAVTTALIGQGVTASGTWAHLHTVIVDALSNPPSTVLAVVIGLLIAVLTLMLIVVWLVRIGVLILLVGVAPLALACHATPFTDAAARLWWRAMLGVLAVVLAQAFALQTALSIFLDPSVNVASLGIPRDPTGTLNLLVVVCLLWITVKIPSLMRRYVTGGRGGPNIGGLIMRMVVVQQLPRLLRKSGTGRGSRQAFGAAASGHTAVGIQRPFSTGGRRSLPPPRGAGQGRVGVAWPTGRPVLPYTPQEIAAGVDVYTRTVPRRPAPTLPRSSRPPIRAAGVAPQPTPQGPRPVLPAGVTPATVMPKRRPVRPPVTGPWNRPTQRGERHGR